MVGGIITVLFIVAVLYLAHRRAPLPAFALSFTILLLAYSVLGSPAAAWKTILWVLLICLWLLNVRPLRISLISLRQPRSSVAIASSDSTS